MDCGERSLEAMDASRSRRPIITNTNIPDLMSSSSEYDSTLKIQKNKRHFFIH